MGERVSEVEPSSVALELERLRGTCTTGFAKLEGALAVLVERSDRTEEDVRQLREDMEKGNKELCDDMEALKARRWPLGVIGTLTGVAGAATGVLSLLLR